MPRLHLGRFWLVPRALTALAVVPLAVLLVSAPTQAPAGEPDPSTYWDVTQVRPGMKGTGRTVMVGTRLEEFGAEVLGVLRDVSPGRDMILCRLNGCDLEHAGIIQGMSGSPIYIDGKLLGAVAYAWEFAKDPIAGVTPFEQMVKYVRSADRRLAAEGRAIDHQIAAAPGTRPAGLMPVIWDDPPEPRAMPLPLDLPATRSGGGLGGMRPIATPLAATGFSPRALALLGRQFEPLGMAPMAGGGVLEEVRQREGDKPLVPGSPMSIAMVTGDFDLSGIGTVTHVEGDRVYGFGHPMFGLGTCDFPMMTGYIHTVYPRASVSMKMGSPLKVVGTLDADVSTGIAGRTGPKPDMLPMSVTVQTGRYSEPRTYRVELARHPKMLSGLVQSVLANAVDTEGDLPEDLTARLTATVAMAGREPITLRDTVSGPRFSGPLGPMSLFGPIASLVGVLANNGIEPVRLESIACEIILSVGRTTAELESSRVETDRVKPGEDLIVHARLRPYQHVEPREVTIALPIPADLPEGNYEATLCDASASLRRMVSASPHLSDPHDLDALLAFLKLQAGARRSSLYLHVPRPDRGLAISGQALTSLPASARAVMIGTRQTAPPTVRAEMTATVETEWVVEGSQALKFQVVKDPELSLRGE
jgi:hypothetical protein